MLHVYQIINRVIHFKDIISGNFYLKLLQKSFKPSIRVDFEELELYSNKMAHIHKIIVM